ncbi:MAG TPA: TIR domain-containing protein [Casimicrobiaceae bacterium]
MPVVFISYRRSDTQMVAGRLRESLARHFGDAAIFRDKNSIAAGEDWTKAIRDELTRDTVVVALIGSTWASAKDDSGRRRLDDPADWNRVELEQALQHGCRVVPLLVDDAKMPKESDLPESLGALARANALKLRDDDWDSDVGRLVQALGPRGTSSRARHAAIAAGALVVVVAAAGAGYWWFGPGEDAPDSKQATVAPSPSSYRSDIIERLDREQHDALALLDSDKPKAIGLIDVNLGEIGQALKAFPDDSNLHTLAGYAAKNVYASSKGFLPPDKRQGYLKMSRKSFERALELAPKNAGAVNGMGNVLFYERRFDEAIEHHERALALVGGSSNYPDAQHDLDLVKRVKRGEAQLDP